MKNKLVYQLKLWILRKKARPQKPEKKHILKNLYGLFEGRETILDASESKIFPIKIEGTGVSDKVSDHSNLKLLVPKQMLQRLPIALAQVKTGNTPDNLLNEMRQVIYSLYQTKGITKKVYNNIMNSIKGIIQKLVLYL